MIRKEVIEGLIAQRSSRDSEAEATSQILGASLMTNSQERQPVVQGNRDYLWISGPVVREERATLTIGNIIGDML